MFVGKFFRYLALKFEIPNPNAQKHLVFTDLIRPEELVLDFGHSDFEFNSSKPLVNTPSFYLQT